MVTLLRETYYEYVLLHNTAHLLQPRCKTTSETPLHQVVLYSLVKQKRRCDTNFLFAQHYLILICLRCFVEKVH
jgi:hypothetical protein